MTFWETEMQRQKELLKPGTYRQQVTMLNKLKAYRKTWYFYEITEDALQDLTGYFKNKLKNKEQKSQIKLIFICYETPLCFY
ncbi:phage integrase SAM-like domain-containing protein [Flavobacterium arcticum]|uniref:phage integrase SAM-like domain-containing protein n=1 Tax=Flavobacterium arcticum TaxID=1784713 RepID=UPI00374423F6